MQPQTTLPSTHSSSPCATPFDAFVYGLIRRKARQLVGRAGITISDRADIEQELAQKILTQMGSFNPAQGHWYVFVTTVVERYVSNILRDRRAEKRDHRRATSLSSIVEYDDRGPIVLSDVIGQREYDARRQRSPRAASDHVELGADVETVLATLPIATRALAHRLMHASVSEVARATALPRTTILGRMKRIRRAFDNAGLRNYL